MVREVGPSTSEEAGSLPLLKPLFKKMNSSEQALELRLSEAQKSLASSPHQKKKEGPTALGVA